VKIYLLLQGRAVSWGTAAAAARSLTPVSCSSQTNPLLQQLLLKEEEEEEEEEEEGVVNISDETRENNL
jgi:hypothetical protein